MEYKSKCNNGSKKKAFTCHFRLQNVVSALNWEFQITCHNIHNCGFWKISHYWCLKSLFESVILCEKCFLCYGLMWLLVGCDVGWIFSVGACWLFVLLDQTISISSSDRLKWKLFNYTNIQIFTSHTHIHVILGSMYSNRK